MPAGDGIELRLEWPAKLPTGVNLNLIIEGKVRNSDTNIKTVEILRYEFRTRTKPSAP